MTMILHNQAGKIYMYDSNNKDEMVLVIGTDENSVYMTPQLLPHDSLIQN